MLTAITGLIAGSLHVFSGADHIAALAPLALKSPRRGFQTGLYWGLGHGLGVVVLGALGIVLGQAVPIDAISSFAEIAVGGLLVLIGTWAVRSAFGFSVHTHQHTHDGGDVHQHVHVHQDGTHHTAVKAHARHSHGALGVGILHGVAGTGHVFGVIPSLALPPAEAVVYLLAYLLAAIGSMGLVALVLSRIAAVGGQRALRALMLVSGVMAIGIGVVWTVQSGSALL